MFEAATAEALPAAALIKYNRFSCPDDAIFSIGKVFLLQGERLQVLPYL